MKSCPKCGKEKEVGEFYKSSSTKSGYSSWCQACDREKGKRYRAEHLDKNKLRAKTYNVVCREKCAEKLRRWRERNRDKTNAYSRIMRETNPVYNYSQQLKCRLYKALRDERYPNRPLMEYLEISTVQKFREYLLTTFFNRYGRYPSTGEAVEIDHIIPTHTATSLEDVDRLNRVSNLQLLTRIDNQKKGSKHVT